MGRTISVEPQGDNLPDDLDGRIVDGLEALRQRVVEAIRFRFNTWFLARNQGLDYDLLIGHQITPALAAAALNDTIRTEAGDELVALRDLTYSLESATRVFSYYVVVDSIYGSMTISENLG